MLHTFVNNQHCWKHFNNSFRLSKSQIFYWKNGAGTLKLFNCI